MYTVEVTKRSNGAGSFHLYSIGDLHSDRREFNEARFKQWRAQIIADPFAVCIFVGDAMEGRTPGMKHFDAACVRPEFLTNLDSYIKQSLDWNQRLLKPITDAGVPLVIVEGNHDRYQEYAGYAAMLSDRVNAQYLGGEGFVRVKSGPKEKRSGTQCDYTTVIYASHGSGGGKRPGGKVNAMQQFTEWVDADVIVQGHVHDGDVRIIHKVGVTTKGDLTLVKRPIVLYRAPSFVERSVQGVVNYAGRQGYPTSDEGLMYVKLNPTEKTARRVEADF